MPTTSADGRYSSLHLILAADVLQSIGQLPQLGQLPHLWMGVMPYASPRCSPKHWETPLATPGSTPTTSVDRGYSSSFLMLHMRTTGIRGETWDFDGLMAKRDLLIWDYEGYLGSRLPHPRTGVVPCASPRHSPKHRPTPS